MQWSPRSWPTSFGWTTKPERGSSNPRKGEQEFDILSGRGWSVNWFDRLRASLGKAREAFAGVQRLGTGPAPLTREFWDELEETLILADFGVPTTQKIVTGCRPSPNKKPGRPPIRSSRGFVRTSNVFSPCRTRELQLDRRQPSIVLVVGVNGSGKTTTIGKLATRLREQRKRVTARRRRHVSRRRRRAARHLGGAQRQRTDSRRRGRRSGVGRVRRTFARARRATSTWS